MRISDWSSDVCSSDLKCELSRFFPEQRQREKEINGLPALYIYGGKAFIVFKDIPHISLPNSNSLGFLAGYLATDGCVDKDGSVMLHSAEREHLEKVRDLATKIGITTYSVTSQSRKGYLAEETDIFRIYFDARSLSEEMLLKSTANERFRGLRKRSEEHTSELQSLMRISYAVFCLKKKKN